MDVIWYSAQEKFNPAELGGEVNWKNWFSDLPQVRETVTFDGMLCPDFSFEKEDEDWNYMVIFEDQLTDIYMSPEVFLKRNIDLEKFNLLACIKEPCDNDRTMLEKDYEFIGYDLMDKKFIASAITNCGGFYDVYSRTDINEYGIFTDRDFAYKIRDELYKMHPEEPHADCYVIEIWRMKS